MKKKEVKEGRKEGVLMSRGARDCWPAGLVWRQLLFSYWMKRSCDTRNKKIDVRCILQRQLENLCRVHTCVSVGLSVRPWHLPLACACRVLNNCPTVRDFENHYFHHCSFLVADERLYKRLCPSVRPSVGEHESKSGKTSVSAPAHPSATGIGRVSGLVFPLYT